MRRIIITTTIFLLLTSCEKAKPLTAQDIIDKAIKKSGVDRLQDAVLSFTFRDKHYRGERSNGEYKLSRLFDEDLDQIEDVLSNTGFKRLVNKKPISVLDSLANVYSESVNSVHYFSKLPLGLNDKAVVKKLLPEITINDKPYYKIHITFKKEGGGVDYNDVFIYWFEKETFNLDYLAYSFHVNGGGMRFRAVTKDTLVKGIRFANYTNYKPKNKLTELSLLDKLYEKNQLIKVSDINLEDIRLSFY